MIVFAVICAVLIVIMNLSVHVETKFLQKKFSMRIRLWKITLLKLPARKKKPEKQNKVKEKENTKSDVKKEKVQLTAEDIRFYLSSISELLNDFKKLFRYTKKKIICDEFVFHLTFGKEDAAEVGIFYGIIWAGLGNLFPILQSILVIKKQSIQVIPVYNQNCLDIDYVGNYRMKIHYLTVIGFKSFSIFIKQLINFIKNQRKKKKEEKTKETNNKEGGV